MITRVLTDKEKNEYNSVIYHPIQTWEWGDFQISQGHKVYRLGVFENNKIISAYSISFHKIPKTNLSIGTVLRGPEIDNQTVAETTKIAKKENAIFVKFEPDIYKNNSAVYYFNNLVTSPKNAFYPYSFIVDLSKTEEELLENLHPKTRYNIKLANRHGVKVEEKTDERGFEIYLKLLFDTTKRQGFYLHTKQYHRDLWNLLKKTDMVHLFLASYQKQVLSAFMVFTLKDKLFYPYGASLDTHREVMAPTLLMWEVIKYGKSKGLKSFDMWGSLGPNAKEGENGYGFHRFKQGYGGQLIEFVGTYDLIINPTFYKIYNFVDKLRWCLLRLKASIFRRWLFI